MIGWGFWTTRNMRQITTRTKHEHRLIRLIPLVPYECPQAAVRQEGSLLIVYDLYSDCCSVFTLATTGFSGGRHKSCDTNGRGNIL